MSKRNLVDVLTSAPNTIAEEPKTFAETLAENERRLREIEAAILAEQQRKIAEAQAVLAAVSGRKPQPPAPQKSEPAPVTVDGHKKKPAAAPQPPAAAPRKGRKGRRETVAALCRRMVLAAHSDDEIRAEVLRVFGPSDRTWDPAAWWRQEMTRKGEIPPATLAKLEKKNRK